MRYALTRFGVAMDESLLIDLDKLAKARTLTRSTLLGDLARAEAMRSRRAPDGQVVMTITVVYDRYGRKLMEKLARIRHDLGRELRSTMRVHLMDNFCLEMIVLKGRTRELQILAGQLLAMRGIKHGGVELMTCLEEK
jgi:CopG family nickel-responsive transcriptional regulator